MLRASKAYRVGCALALVAALLGSAVRFRRSTGVFTPLESPDFVTLHELRMRAIREALGGVAEVGYVSPAQTGAEFARENLWGFSSYAERTTFFLTQYALAPVVVRNDRSPDVLVVPAIETAPRLPGYEPVLGASRGAEILRKRSDG
jgi:hypothetical protein